MKPSHLPNPFGLHVLINVREGEVYSGHCHCTNTEQPPISPPPVHERVFKPTMQKGHSKHSRHNMSSARQDGGEHLTLTVLSLLFREITLLLLLRVYAGGSLACASLKWHISQAGNEINSAHLHRTAEMGSALNHSSWQDHASQRHFRNLWKNFCPSQSSGVMSVSSIFSCPTLGEASTCCLTGQTQTDRHRGDRQRGRPGEEPVAMPM